MKALKLIQRLNRKKIQQATGKFLSELAPYQPSRYRRRVDERLTKLEGRGGPLMCIGSTKWGRSIHMPLDHLFAHSLIVGASGAGKSYIALQIILGLLGESDAGFGLLDAKGELYGLVVHYLYAFLYQLSPTYREAFKRRITLIDFSDSQMISPYNILLPHSGQDLEVLVNNRLDTISDLFSDDTSGITPRMRTVLKYFFVLASNARIPLTSIDKLIDDRRLLEHFVSHCPDERVRNYFHSRFDKEPEITVQAVRQRLDAILASESVRLALSADTAPDFRKLQDEGAIVLVNTAGRNISRSVSLLLQILILQDIKQSIFSRKEARFPYLWFFDEAQNFYRSRSAQSSMNEILTMARSFGSFACLMTQAATSAISDSDALNTLLANIRWLLMFRSTSRDARLIEPAIPLTGNCQRPQRHPYEQPEYMGLEEEKRHRLNAINYLPDRRAYLWLKSEMPEAVMIQTANVPSPQAVAGCSQQEFERFVGSEELGQRIKREELLSQIKKDQREMKDIKAAETSKGSDDLLQSLEEEYKKKASRRKAK